jgi:hypothetical protein
LINVNKDISSITPDSFIISGGGVKDLRKLSKTQYSVYISAVEGAKNMSVQVEADKVKDKENFTNDNASNEVSVNVTGEVKSDTSASQNPDQSILDSLTSTLSSLTSSQPATQYCNGVQIDASQVCNPAATTQAANNGSSGSGAASGPSFQDMMMMSMLGNMVGGLLKNGSSLFGGGAGSKAGNGSPGTGGSGDGGGPAAGTQPPPGTTPPATPPATQPLGGVVQRVLDVEHSCTEIKDLAANKILSKEDNDTMGYQMTDPSDKKPHALLIYNSSNGTGAKLVRGSCTTYEPNSLTKVTDKAACCNVQYDPQTKKCPGIESGINGTLYRNKGTQKFTKDPKCLNMLQTGGKDFVVPGPSGTLEI